MDTVHFYQNKKEILQALLIVLILFFISLYGAYSHFDSSHSHALFCIILATVLFLLSLRFLRVLIRKPKLIATVTDDGIIFPSYGHIAWRDIAAVKIISYNGQEFLGFCLFDPASYQQKLSTWRRMARSITHYFFDVHYTIGNLNIPIDQAYKIVFHKAGFIEPFNNLEEK